MKSRIFLFMTLCLAVASSVFVASQDVLLAAFPSLKPDTLQIIQLVISALSGILASFPVGRRNATIFAGDAAAVEVPEQVYPAIWTILSWVFSLIFKKKGGIR